jgi:hypothetical protein
MSTPATPAAAVTEASWSPDALEQLVAPIALYPDALIGQILAASANSQEVLDAGNWLLQNQQLQGDALDSAAQTAGFGPALRALVHFPTVVDMMCEQIDWTRQLGSAFTSDQKAVLDAVQTLRTQAAQVGNLKSTPQQTVETKTENDKTVIEVKPADPQVIYVPQYNPQVVYTTPPPPPPPAQSTVSTDTAVLSGLLAFGIGMAVGSAMQDNYCYPHWGAGSVYVGPRPFYPPAYVYRPAYGPAFRPAYGYARPAGYRYAYNNTAMNRNVNVNVNNNEYFNQFNRNQNLRNTNASNNISRTTTNGAPSWKGQSTYAGTRNPAQTQRFNEAAGRAPGTSAARSPSRNYGSPSQSRQGQSGPQGTPNRTLADNSTPSSRAPQDRPNPRSPRADRGYGDSNRALGETAAAGARDATKRDTNSSRSEQSGRRTTVAQRDSAFSGASNPEAGAQDRAASARGNASAGGLRGAEARGSASAGGLRSAEARGGARR